MTGGRRVHHRSTWRVLAWLATAALLVAAFVPTSVAAADGHNGTVKIHEGSDHGDPPKTDRNNQPHVCTFHLHGFAFDPDDAGQWRIYDWPPTGTKSQVLNGTWSGSEFQSVVMTLPDGHYRLAWNIGEDPEDPKDEDATSDKHKEFWVECAAPSEEPSEEPSTEPSEAPSEEPPKEPSTAPSEEPSAAPSEEPSEEPSTEPSEAPSEEPSAEPSEAPSTAPSEEPSESPSETPSETPSEAPSTSPSGGVEAATGTPRVTPPATDQLGGTNVVGDQSWRIALGLLAMTIGGAMLLTSRRTSRR
jgi:hypothetical protein